MNKAKITENNGGVDYGVWGFLTGVIAFIGIWIYAIATWGLLLGLMFGWIPALIGGFIFGIVWPIVALAIVGIIILIASESNNTAKTTTTNFRNSEYRVTATPRMVGVVDNTKTLIVCNYGNKKTFTAKQANITFTGTDFTESYLPDSKRTALQEVCEITPQEIEAGLDTLWEGEDITPLFEVKPAYK